MRDHDYKEIAERMKADAFHKGCDITVLTEDIDDNEFWRRIIENVKPNLNNKIDFANPSSKGTRGKHILKKFKDSVTAKFIICIDSDCEYLYDNSTWYMADYIYHTVVYSKENFQCNYFAFERKSESKIVHIGKNIHFTEIILSFFAPLKPELIQPQQQQLLMQKSA